MLLVKSIDHLKELAYRENGDFIHFEVRYPLFKIGRRIQYNKEEDLFSIINEMDESYYESTTADLTKKTLIPKAINKEGFWYCE